MSNAVATRTGNGNGVAAAGPSEADWAVMERVIAAGDLSALSPGERARYYLETCRSMGLNPLTKPFEYIELNRKLTLYATKGCADQLRKLHGISPRVVSREVHAGVVVVTVEGTDRTGRTGSEIGAVSVDGLRGEALANAWMKATTKAKRRLTLSMVGLGMLDEGEVESVPGARVVAVDAETGEILGEPPAAAAGGPAGRGQRQAINELRASLGLTGEEVRALIRDRYGVAGSTQMTAAHADDLVGHLEERYREAFPEPPADEAGVADAEFSDVGAGLPGVPGPAGVAGDDRYTR